MRNTRTAVLALLLLAVAGCDGYNPTSIGPSVGGQVLDAVTNQPVEGVLVEVGGRIAASAPNGVYYVADVPQGNHQLRATKAGYQEYLAEVNVASSVANRTIHLAK